MGQVAWASFDVALHTTSSSSIDPEAIWDQLVNEMLLIPDVPGSFRPSTFVHIVDYDGMFYTYHWSEVYSVDLFSRFEQEGIFNPAIGSLYREEILAPGGSRDGMVSLVAFLGRQPSVDAFLKAKGLSADASLERSTKRLPDKGCQEQTLKMRKQTTPLQELHVGARN